VRNSFRIERYNLAVEKQRLIPKLTLLRGNLTNHLAMSDPPAPPRFRSKSDSWFLRTTSPEDLWPFDCVRSR
jgi:hypothetical protein